MFKIKFKYLFTFCAFLAFNQLVAQEETPFVTYDVPSQNLMKFNRFLINPTFSTVREDKSYFNLQHRNQAVNFDDNFQTYFLSYSGRIGDRAGVGLSLYSQREALIDNYGILANYAYGVKLSEKSNFTFGANFSYYNSGFSQGRARPIDDDPTLNSLEASALISFQPGFNISYGNFDFGLFAENLFDYNVKTSESVTEFNEKTFSGHLQYTHQLENGRGIFENARIMPLARVRKVGQDDIVLGGSLITDLPKLGWLQAGYDTFYGASAGLGFNLTNRISLGYTIEKGFGNNFENFGSTHEISLAYSFTPTLTEDRVMLEKRNNRNNVVSNRKKDDPIEETTLSEEALELAEIKKKLADNNEILNELILRQDSVEKAREGDLERRFNMVMRMVRRETNGQNPELEKRAKEVFFTGIDTLDATKSFNTNDQKNTATAPITFSNTNLGTAKAQKDKRDGNNSIVKDKIVTTNTAGPVLKDSGDAVTYDIPHANTGYYLVANVFRTDKYMERFLKKLLKMGFEADYIENPENGRKYVYLKKFSTRKDVMEAYKSKMGGTYKDDIWMMRVKGDDGIPIRLSPNDDASRYGKDALYKNSQKAYGFNGVGSGYYMITEILDTRSEARKLTKKLKAQGLNAGYFTNPKDRKKYVYLKRHQTWSNALTAYYSKLNNAYDGTMWIMRVKPNRIS